jgi:hypothetical protein
VRPFFAHHFDRSAKVTKMPVHDILFHEKGLDFHNNVLYFHDNVIDFLNNALYRILSETGQISGYFLLFFAQKSVSFANSVTQKSVYPLAVHILYVILRILCILHY